MNLDTSGWLNFRLSDYFEIKAGVYHYPDEYDIGETPYVSASATTNGVSQYINLKPEFSGNCIVTGKVGCNAFYQSEPFCATSDVNVFVPLFNMSSQVGLFIVSVINFSENYRWCYGRQCRVGDSKEIIVKLPATPDGKPDWQWMESYIDSLHSRPLVTQSNSHVASFDTSTWKWFVIEDLFDKLETGKGHDTLLDDGDECFYLGAKKSDNGVMRKCAVNESMLQDGNCIVFICNGAGSVGYANYMDKQFIATTDLVLGYADWLNKKTGLFVATVLCKERFKYSFGRKWKTHLRDTKIKLPVTLDGKPDWQWMENYIKSLPYGDRL